MAAILPPISVNNLPPSVLISNVCASKISNAYFDGTTCYCKAGFRNVSNSCVPIS